MNRRRARLITCGLIGLGLLLRLWVVFVVAPTGFSWGDEAAYVQRAEVVARTGDPGSAWQPPLYSYVLAIPVRLGISTVPAARVINVFAFLLAAWGLVVLANGWRNAVVPMAVLAFHPLLVAFSWLLFSEEIFLALFIWALALQRISTGSALIASGIVWGLVALTRTIGLPFFLVSLFLHSRAFPSRLSTRRSSALLLLGFAVTITPWISRNYQELGAPVLSTSAGFNLWVGNSRDLNPAYEWRAEELGAFLLRYREFSEEELERDRIAMGRALDFIAEEQPTWVFRKAWEGITHLLAHENYVLRRLHRHSFALTLTERDVIAVVTLGGEFAVVIWGLWLLFSVRPSGRLVLVMALILVAVAVHVTTIGDSRHRLGIEFLFFGLAGCEARVFSLRRVWWTGLVATVLGVIGLFSSEVGDPILFGPRSGESKSGSLAPDAGVSLRPIDSPRPS